MKRVPAVAPFVLLLSLDATVATAASPAAPARWLEDIGDSSVIDSAIAPDGRIAVLLATCNPGGCDLQVQRYDQDGVPSGGRLFIETVDGPSLERGYGSVALDDAGHLVVGLPDQKAGHLLCYQPDGTRIPHAIRGGYTEGTFVQDLAIAGDGTFVVGWTQEHVPEGLYHLVNVRFRKFNADTCQPKNAAQLLERYIESLGPKPLSDLRDLSIAMSANGWLAAAWTHQDRTGATRVKVKTFKPGGGVFLDRQVAGDIRDGTAGDVGIADDGQTIVAFHPPSDTLPGQAAVRRYSAQGVAYPSLDIDAIPLPGDANVHVGVGAGGDFVTAWTSFPEAANSRAAVREFDAAGGALGDAGSVNASPGHFTTFDVLHHGDGGYTVLYAQFFPEDVPAKYFVQRYEAP